MALDTATPAARWALRSSGIETACAASGGEACLFIYFFLEEKEKTHILAGGSAAISN